MNRLLIVDVESGLKSEIFDDDDGYVDQSHCRMIRKNVPTTFIAPFSFADDGFITRFRIPIEHRDLFRSLGDVHILRFPEGKGADRTCRPVAARIAMAVSHGFGFTCQRELHGAAETTGFVT